MLNYILLAGLIQNALNELNPSTIILEITGFSNAVINCRCDLISLLVVLYIPKEYIWILYMYNVLLTLLGYYIIINWVLNCKNRVDEQPARSCVCFTGRTISMRSRKYRRWATWSSSIAHTSATRSICTPRRLIARCSPLAASLKWSTACSRDAHATASQSFGILRFKSIRY